MSASTRCHPHSKQQPKALKVLSIGARNGFDRGMPNDQRAECHRPRRPSQTSDGGQQQPPSDNLSRESEHIIPSQRVPHSLSISGSPPFVLNNPVSGKALAAAHAGNHRRLAPCPSHLTQLWFNPLRDLVTKESFHGLLAPEPSKQTVQPALQRPPSSMEFCHKAALLSVDSQLCCRPVLCPRRGG